MERSYAEYLQSSKPTRLNRNQMIAFIASYANVDRLNDHVYLERANINSTYRLKEISYIFSCNWVDTRWQ